MKQPWWFGDHPKEAIICIHLLISNADKFAASRDQAPMPRLVTHGLLMRIFCGLALKTFTDRVSGAIGSLKSRYFDDV